MAYHLVEEPTRVNRRLAAAVFKLKADCKISNQKVATLLGVSISGLKLWMDNRQAMSVKYFEQIVDALPLPESYFLMESDREAAMILDATDFSAPLHPTAETQTEEETVMEGYDEEVVEEAAEQPAWFAEFPSMEELVRFLTRRCIFDPGMYPLDDVEEMQDYINYCLQNHIPMVIKPGN